MDDDSSRSDVAVSALWFHVTTESQYQRLRFFCSGIPYPNDLASKSFEITAFLLGDAEPLRTANAASTGSPRALMDRYVPARIPVVRTRA